MKPILNNLYVFSLITFIGVLFFLCVSAYAGCEYDTQCRKGRICDEGKCVYDKRNNGGNQNMELDALLSSLRKTYKLSQEWSENRSFEYEANLRNCKSNYYNISSYGRCAKKAAQDAEEYASDQVGYSKREIERKYRQLMDTVCELRSRKVSMREIDTFIKRNEGGFWVTPNSAGCEY